VTLCFEIVNWTRERHRAATLYVCYINHKGNCYDDTSGLLYLFVHSYIETNTSQTKHDFRTTARFHIHSASTPFNLLSRVVSLSPMRPAILHSTPTPRLCRFHTTASRPRSPTQAVFSRANSHLETQLARCCEQQHRSTNTYSAGTPANGSVTDQLPPSERLP
jgi:hypothetical protein